LPRPDCLSAQQVGNSGASVKAGRTDNHYKGADHTIGKGPGYTGVDHDAGFPAIYGRQLLYFKDETFAARAAIPPPAQ